MDRLQNTTKIILHSKNRVNNRTSANDSQFYIDWGSILDDGEYRVTYSICKNILPPLTPWTFRVKSSTSVVPSSVDGIPVTNVNNVTMFNDPIRGFVFQLLGNNCLSINQPTPVNSTKTFWVSAPNPSAEFNNVFSTTKMPIWFQKTNLLRATVNFGVAGTTNVVSTHPQTSIWKFYAITTSGTTTSVYANGVLVSTANVNWTGDTSAICIGGYTNLSFLTGFMDDIRLYSSILSPEEIQRLYETTI
jgi:Concanavalin A-like lectin/glucanases superfamily